MTKNVSIPAPVCKRENGEISAFFNRLPVAVREALADAPASDIDRLMSDVERAYPPFSAIQAMSFNFTRGLERDDLIEAERDLADKPLKRTQAVQRLHKRALEAVEYVHLWAGLVGGRAADKVVSALCFDTHKLKRRDTLKWSRKQKVVPLGCGAAEQPRYLAEVIEKSRIGRRAERWFQAYYLQSLADRPDWQWKAFFLTLTLPGEWHPNPSVGKNSWNSETIRAGSDELNRRARAALKDATDALGHRPRRLGLGYREFQADCTPHLHDFVFIHPDDAPVYLACLKKHFPGPALKVEPHDNGKGRFATYCVAYLRSGDEGDAEEAAQAKKPGSRYAAAANRHRIRRTETYGFRRGFWGQWRTLGQQPSRPAGIMGEVWRLMKSGDHAALIDAADLMDAVPSWDLRRSQEYAALGETHGRLKDQIADLKTERGRLSRRAEDRPQRAQINAQIDALQKKAAAIWEARCSIPEEDRKPCRAPSGWENETVKYNAVTDRPTDDPRAPGPEDLERTRIDAIVAPDGYRLSLEKHCLLVPSSESSEGVSRAIVGNGPRDLSESKRAPAHACEAERWAERWAKAQQTHHVARRARKARLSRRRECQEARREAQREPQEWTTWAEKVRRIRRTAAALGIEPGRLKDRLPASPGQLAAEAAQEAAKRRRWEQEAEAAAARAAARAEAAAADYADRLKATGLPLTLDLITVAAEAAGLLIEGDTIRDAADKKSPAVRLAALGAISRSLSAEWRLRHAGRIRRRTTATPAAKAAA